MRGRSAAVTWLVEKLAEAVRNSPAGPEQRPDADRCMALLDQLVQRINDLGMEMDAGPLRGALRHVAVMRADDVEPSTPDALTTQPSGPPSNQDDEESWQSASTVDANPNGVQAEIGSGPTKPAKTPSPAAQSTAAQTAPKPSSLQADPELRRMVKRCTDEMRKIAGAWLERDLRDSRAYRFARMSAWAGVEKAPRNDEGTVDLPPPLPNRLNTVLGLYQQKRYPEFIVEAEQINARHIFWLDGHRLVALALNGMGEQFEPAAQAVVDEVSSFLERVPEVLELRFSDGTPFAGASTRAWLEQEEAVETVGKEEGTALTQTGVSEQWGAVATKAAELADNGDFAAVARLFSEHRALASGRRSRFHWRLTEAGFYYRYGHDDVVIGMVDGMLDEVARYAIDEWEPELALSLAELGVRSAERLGKSSPGDYIDSIRQRAFELLCRLDPGSAMKVRS
ncbi:MAG: type VI secretion system domain-containing protein [Gammaproteobacteria bacterium]